MNKALLIWNVVITIALAAAVFSGCTTLDPQLASAVKEAKENRALLEQVANLANQNREEISSMKNEVTKNTLTISSLQSSTEAAISTMRVSFEQYVQQYVQAYVSEAVQ